MGHKAPRRGDARDREGPAPQVARSHRAGRLGLCRQGERAGEREQRRGGQRPRGAEEPAPRTARAQGIRRPAGGGYSVWRGMAAPAGRPPVRRRWRVGLLPRPRRSHGLGARRSALGARRSALGARRSALGARRSALGARRSALGARRSALGARRSALGARRSALGARRSALGARRSALGARRSALGARRSALGARRSALGARRSYSSGQPPTTSHNSIPLPRRSRSAPRSFSGIHGTPLARTNHIDLLRHCKYGCFNCKNKSIYIKDCVFLPLAYPLDPPAQARRGTAPAPCREAG